MHSLPAYSRPNGSRGLWKVQRCFAAIAFACVYFASHVEASSPSEPQVFDVWPKQAPGEPSGIEAEKVLDPQPNQRQVKRITNVTQPTITVFRAPKDRDTGATVLIAPGGGYNILAWDLEGEEVAEWLNSIGVTGIVLKYRVPRRPGQTKDAPPPTALQDAQRAMSLVRHRASQWGIDPKRIGMLGFSAGGHLTAWTSTSFEQRTYDPIDAVDQVSCRPDFAVLIYPAYLAEKGSATLKSEVPVTKDTPPMFLVHAGDDHISAENSAALYLALLRAAVPAELHVYARGGHGFGLRPSDDPCSNWPAVCAAWMARQGITSNRTAKP